MTETSPLKQRIQADVISAMKAKEQARLGTLRMLQAALKQKEVDERVTLTDQDILAILQKMIKQRQDALEQFTAGNRPDLAQKEQSEMDLLSAYLPTPLTDSEIAALIDEAIKSTQAKGMQDMGKVMGLLKNKLQGRADMGKVSQQIKSRLS